MRRLAKAIVLLLFFYANCMRGESRAFAFDGYKEADGAITVAYGGDLVDPYFATRALLVAHRGGVPDHDAALSWIAWLLPRQDESGLFHRYCRENGAWLPCKSADADDALLAIWAELLYAMAPPQGLPPAWERSGRLALRRLENLKDESLGVYRISAIQDVALFMDNVEIYAAMKSVGGDLRRMGRAKEGSSFIREARDLRLHIERVFHGSPRAAYRVSTQESGAAAFYPQLVAQIYPPFYRMPLPGTPSSEWMDAWLREHGEAWLALNQDPYPWGMVALAAAEVGRCDVARRWADAAEPLRYSDRWNVLEEAVLEVIRKGTAFNSSCAKGKR